MFLIVNGKKERVWKAFLLVFGYMKIYVFFEEKGTWSICWQ